MRVLFKSRDEERQAQIAVRLLRSPLRFSESKHYRALMDAGWARIGRNIDSRGNHRGDAEFVLTDYGRTWAMLFDSIGVKEGE
ncbi:MAG: hypothetical protein ACRDQZ_25135 [Mycobacteriales bacterium]